MERDARRDRGQWRGCHSFRDIICDGDNTLCMRRNGGLKQGETYYYYYELDGATETYDPSLPSTTACPFLPGQKVNTLSVPREQCLRKRSASMNSMRTRDFKTMNPEDKFVTPRAPPPVPGSSVVRAGTSPNPVVRYDHQPSRSESPPIQSWPWSPRRLFTRKSSSRSLDKDHLMIDDDIDNDDMTRPGSSSLDHYENWRSSSNKARSDGSRSRDISPESLRRFLIDDAPAADHERPSVLIPEDIAEEMDDDDNFASPASTDSMLLTGLSPPPKRATSSSTMLVVLESPVEESSPVEIPAFPSPPTRPPPQLPMLQPPELDFPQSHFSVSSASSVASPLSPRSPDATDLPSFYHSESEEDDLHSSQDESLPSIVGADDLAPAFAGYRLPSDVANNSKLALDTTAMTAASPALFGGHDDSDVPISTTSLLSSPASGLEDLVSELGWMADVIRGKGGAS